MIKRKIVSWVAYDRFIDSIDTSLPLHGHMIRLHREARLNDWADRTVNEIQEKLMSMYVKLNPVRSSPFRAI